MNKTDDLFQLINSMSKSEKGYFKKFSTVYATEGTRNYIKLFDAIEKQKVYDENKILKLFNKEQFIKRLPVEKNNLLHLILKCLKVYHSGKTMEQEVKELLEYVEILFDKHLYKLCWKKLKKVKKIASETENFLYLLEIKTWENKLLHIEHKLEELKELIKTAPEEEEDIVRKYLNYRKYRWAHSENLLAYHQIGAIRNKEDGNNYQLIIKKGVLAEENKALSVKAKYFFFISHAFFHYVSYNYIESYRHLKQLVQLMDLPPILSSRKKINDYIMCLHNLSLLCLRLKKFHEIQDLLNKMRTCLNNDKESRKLIFCFSANIELLYYCNTGYFKKGIELAKEVEMFLDSNSNQIDETILFQLYRGLSELYHGNMDYSNALKWINVILNEKSEAANSQLYFETKIFNLIIHYEMNNTELLEYLVKSVYHFLYIRKRAYQFETHIINFLRRRVLGKNSGKELILEFKQLKETLITLSKDPFEKKALDFFDYISWLESKIEKRPFADVVREKAKF